MKYRDLCVHSFFFSPFCTLVITESAVDDSVDESMIYGLLEDNNNFICLRPPSCSLLCGLYVSLLMTVAGFRGFTSTNDSDTKGEVGGEGAKTDARF